MKNLKIEISALNRVIRKTHLRIVVNFNLRRCPLLERPLSSDPLLVFITVKAVLSRVFGSLENSGFADEHVPTVRI